MMVNNTIATEEFEFDIEMTLDHPRVKRYLKVGNLEAMRDKIDEGLETASDLIKPRAIYTIMESDEGELDRYDAPVPLRGNDYLAFGVSTVGDPISEKV